MMLDHSHQYPDTYPYVHIKVARENRNHHPARTTIVRSWTYAASAAFEARTCSTCGAEAEAHWQRAARRNPRHAESRSYIGVAH